MMSDYVTCSVAVYDWHLNIHEDYIWFFMGGVGSRGEEEVVEGFFAVPNCFYLEAELFYGSQGYLLVDGASVGG